MIKNVKLKKKRANLRLKKLVKSAPIFFSVTKQGETLEYYSKTTQH